MPDARMVRSFAEDLLQMLRRFGLSITFKLSNVFHSYSQFKNAGALVGLAFAFFCTWRYLKTSTNRLRTWPKRDALTGIMNGAENYSGSGKGPNMLTETALSHTVKQKLMGGRKVACQLLGIVLEETTPEALQAHVVIRTAVVDVLLELARTCDLYLFARVLDDQSEASVIAALEAAGVFTGNHTKSKVLFCSTELGSLSFVRQLEPEWHIDSSLEKIEQLTRFIRYQLLITPSRSSSLPSNVFLAESLEGYFEANHQ